MSFFAFCLKLLVKYQWSFYNVVFLGSNKRGIECNKNRILVYEQNSLSKHNENKNNILPYDKEYKSKAFVNSIFHITDSHSEYLLCTNEWFVISQSHDPNGIGWLLRQSKLFLFLLKQILHQILTDTFVNNVW